MRVGSLFAGVGGFDIAAERAGMEVAWQSEVDPHASRVLEYYWPGKNLGDIHGIQSPPTVDVLTGGFPCQDYSVAGPRAGLAGDRGALWWQFHRLITEGRPQWVVGENVAGLLSSGGGRDFATIVDSLVECGYGVAWGVLDAQYFGVAQRRRRVFIVGHSGGQPRPEILALSEGMFGHPQPSRQEGEGVAKRLTTGVGTRYGFQIQAELIGRNPDAGPNGKGITDLQTDPAYTLNVAGGVQAVAFAQNQRDETLFQGSTVRRLTPLECERLQGFPDNWTDTPGNGDTRRYRQMGNAVAVPVAEWIMRRIRGGV